MKNSHLLLLILIVLSCERDLSSYYTYTPPAQLNDGISVGTLQEVGMNPQLLAQAVGRIYANKYDQVHSMLIYKDGRLVFEEYFEGNKFLYEGQYHYGERVQWHRDSMHVIHSCTKSFVSALVAIAIEQGHIEGVHQSIFDFLPDHQRYRQGGKEDITIEHLLTMSSGLKWDEWSSGHGSAANDIDRLYWECDSDPVACVLAEPLLAKPGEKFTYHSGGTIVLGEILKYATGSNIEDYSKEHLFKPLGIDTIFWSQFRSGVYAAEGGLRMTSRDMLKFGITYLKDGGYEGQRIIPESWVEKSGKPFGNNKRIKIPISDFGRMGYAYSWWTDEVEHGNEQVQVYAASGWGGKRYW